MHGIVRSSKAFSVQVCVNTLETVECTQISADVISCSLATHLPVSVKSVTNGHVTKLNWASEAIQCINWKID
jgi:hypothetical protein